MQTAGPKRRELEARIQALKLEFENGMRVRGFDPEQAENVPIPPALAQLKAEHDDLIVELEILESEIEDDRN
jgi:hypothetical protein